MRVRAYRLALRAPLRLPGGGVLTHREGLLVQDAASGGWGDAAPLPGFSRERVEDLRREMEGREGEGGPRPPPSLRFARECARRGNAPPAEGVELNALWWAEREPLERLLSRLKSREGPVVKIKPGRRPDPAAWGRLCAERPDARIRLDPNRAWTVEALRRYAGAIPANQLEYVEEPLARREAYGRLSRGEGVPIALDETLREADPETAGGIPGVVALVMKPTLMGDAEDRRPWMELAAGRGWTVVWSAAFESGVGLWHLARLAAGGAAAGLDTASALAEDVVDPRPCPDASGWIRPREWRVVEKRSTHFFSDSG